MGTMIPWAATFKTGFVAAAATAGGGEGGGANPMLTDFALQQQMFQLHQHQIWQQQLLEQQLQKHKEMMTAEHEKQRSLLIARHVSIPKKIFLNLYLWMMQLRLVVYKVATLCC